ncbi:fimbrial protein [Pseudomonas anuradhapurensis]|uniref:fimbrial protein n=1 Tax=Pseudomonas anuradhapurensis TaxID=485870 RepID=UPI001644108F|nr:fimbrial protein [Pseudomonas anuradhapurensis]
MAYINLPNALLLAIAFYSLTATANASLSQITATIKGVVYADPPCIVNNNSPIIGSFGDVDVEKIDGNHKTITLNYSLDCSRAVSNNLRFYISGKSTEFDRWALYVPDHKNIGITFKRDGHYHAINTYYSLNPLNPPTLQAVLIKRPDGDINGGPFRSSATLVVEYQ